MTCSAGVLVPDIPLEETGEIRDAATEAGLELILLTTPTTPRDRMQAIAKASQGFVYLVSVTGAPHLGLHALSMLSKAFVSAFVVRWKSCLSIQFARRI